MTRKQIEAKANEIVNSFGWPSVIYAASARAACMQLAEWMQLQQKESLVWKIIEDFQEMMNAEGLDRETEINNKHLSYNDVEHYLYSLLPSPPKNTDNG